MKVHVVGGSTTEQTLFAIIFKIIMENSDELQGKTIVITGVSSEFGRGSSLKLAELGANVVGLARRDEALASLSTEIANKGGNFISVTGDVSDPETIQTLATTAISEFGGIDIWINNVGIGAIGFFWDIPIQDHSRVIDVNLKGLVYGSHAAIKHFLAIGKGTLINIGSIDSEVPLAMQNTYAATKAAVFSLSRSVAEELKLYGNDTIKISTIMPWAVDTPWWNHAANYTGHKPRMAAMDDPKIVIDAIIEACKNPESKIPVGYKATGSNIFHRIFPGWAEQFSSKVAKKESDKAFLTPHTTGSIYEPMPQYTGVEGGIRARMEIEDEEE